MHHAAPACRAECITNKTAPTWTRGERFHYRRRGPDFVLLLVVVRERLTASDKPSGRAQIFISIKFLTAAAFLPNQFTIPWGRQCLKKHTASNILILLRQRIFLHFAASASFVNYENCMHAIINFSDRLIMIRLHTNHTPDANHVCCYWEN